MLDSFVKLRRFSTALWHKHDVRCIARRMAITAATLVLVIVLVPVFLKLPQLTLLQLTLLQVTLGR